MSDWLLELPILEMAVVVFIGVFGIAGLVYFAVARLAVGERAKAIKALSPGMLPPLGIIFGLLVGFTAAQVWSDFERAKTAVANEASALRTVNLLATAFPSEHQDRIKALIAAHVKEAVEHEWPGMAHGQVTLAKPSAALSDVLKAALALAPENDAQRAAQNEIIRQVDNALEARRQRIIISQATVTRVKWAGILLQGLIALIAIAMVHSDNRLTCLIALGLFSTGIAISVLLIAVYSTPLSGEISVGPALLQQVGLLSTPP